MLAKQAYLRRLSPDHPAISEPLYVSPPRLHHGRKEPFALCLPFSQSSLVVRRSIGVSHPVCRQAVSLQEAPRKRNPSLVAQCTRSQGKQPVQATNDAQVSQPGRIQPHLHIPRSDAFLATLIRFSCFQLPCACRSPSQEHNRKQLAAR